MIEIVKLHLVRVFLSWTNKQWDGQAQRLKDIKQQSSTLCAAAIHRFFFLGPCSLEEQEFAIRRQKRVVGK